MPGIAEDLYQESLEALVTQFAVMEAEVSDELPGIARRGLRLGLKAR